MDQKKFLSYERDHTPNMHNTHPLLREQQHPPPPPPLQINFNDTGSLHPADRHQFMQMNLTHDSPLWAQGHATISQRQQSSLQQLHSMQQPLGLHDHPGSSLLGSSSLFPPPVQPHVMGSLTSSSSPAQGILSFLPSNVKSSTAPSPSNLQPPMLMQPLGGTSGGGPSGLASPMQQPPFSSQQQFLQQHHMGNSQIRGYNNVLSRSSPEIGGGMPPYSLVGKSDNFSMPPQIPLQQPPISQPPPPPPLPSYSTAPLSTATTSDNNNNTVPYNMLMQPPKKCTNAWEQVRVTCSKIMWYADRGTKNTLSEEEIQEAFFLTTNLLRSVKELANEATAASHGTPLSNSSLSSAQHAQASGDYYGGRMHGTSFDQGVPNGTDKLSKFYSSNNNNDFTDMGHKYGGPSSVVGSSSNNNNSNNNHSLSSSDTADDDQPKKRKRRRNVTQPMECRTCGVTSTPEWRKGPDGTKSLCNACGLHYAKILKKGINNMTTRSRSFQVRMLLNELQGGTGNNNSLLQNKNEDDQQQQQQQQQLPHEQDDGPDQEQPLQQPPQHNKQQQQQPSGISPLNDSNTNSDSGSSRTRGASNRNENPLPSIVTGNNNNSNDSSTTINSGFKRRTSPRIIDIYHSDDHTGSDLALPVMGRPISNNNNRHSYSHSIRDTVRDTASTTAELDSSPHSPRPHQSFNIDNNNNNNNNNQGGFSIFTSSRSSPNISNLSTNYSSSSNNSANKDECERRRLSPMLGYSNISSGNNNYSPFGREY